MPMNLPTIIAICGGCVVLNILTVCLIARMAISAKRKPTKRSAEPAAHRGQPAKRKKSLVDRIGTMNLILIIIGITLLAFTIAIMNLFKQYGTIPDTLVSCVFAVLGGECGVMGWIKTTKDKNKVREWEKEDMREAQKAIRQDGEDEPPKF
jgi:hypothetical protein